MRAAMVESPGRLVVRDVPMPEVGPYDALCQLLYGATCTGTDQHLINNTFPFGVTYPTILGHESVGRVVDVGAKVRYLTKGDLVTRVGAPPDPHGAYAVHWGGFAEYGLARDHRAMAEDGCPRDQWWAYRVNRVLPAEIDPAEATLVITWRETFSFITRMGMGVGRRLLVIGSGGNGLAFAAHATNLGVSLVAMIGSAGRESAARAVGVSHYVDYRAARAHEAVEEACPGGFDFIIDAVGRSGLLDAALRHGINGGRVAIYGIDDFGQCTVNPTHARGSFTFYNGGYDEAEAHDQVVAFMRAGRLNARLWVDPEHPFPLERIQNAFAAVRERRHVKALVALA